MKDRDHFRELAAKAKKKQEKTRQNRTDKKVNEIFNKLRDQVLDFLPGLEDRCELAAKNGLYNTKHTFRYRPNAILDIDVMTNMSIKIKKLINMCKKEADRRNLAHHYVVDVSKANVSFEFNFIWDESSMI